MSSNLRNLVIFTDEGDVLFSHYFDVQWQFGPDSLLANDFFTSLFLLAQQQDDVLSMISFNDEVIGFLHQGAIFYCVVAEVSVLDEKLYSILEKIAIHFQNRYGLLLTQFNGQSTFFRGFIDYLTKKHIIPTPSVYQKDTQRQNLLKYPLKHPDIYYD